MDATTMTRRLANQTRFADRAEWLRARKDGIGASEAAAILGVSPWTTPMEVFLRKTGRAPEVEESPAMAWGTAKEGALAAEYTRRYGRPLHTQVFLRHEDHPWMFATIDGLTPEGVVVELKTTSWRSADQWGEEETDEIPTHYLCQVHHQLAVSGLDLAHVFAEIGGEPPRRYVIRRNDEVIGHVVDIEAAFWEDTQRDIPPTLLKPSDHRLMHLLHPEAEGAIVLDQADATIVDRWLVAKEGRKAGEDLVDSLKTAVLGLLGPFASAMMPDGRIVTRKVIPPTWIEGKSYLRGSYTDLRVRKAKV